MLYTILLILSFKFAPNYSYIVEPVNLAQSPYALWAHFHWIWLANHDETQDSLIQLLDDYDSYSIPVGGIIIDSSWPETYQNFKWNSTKFPNPGKMIDYFHSKNVKVLCWITSNINNDSTNFQEAKANGYFLSNGKLVNWGHGNAAFIDYSNPKALKWWHNLMDPILDLGIDGWKTDGTDPFVLELYGARGYKGHITEREYANSYYRDFFNYTKSKRGDDILIMARPVDSYKNILFYNFAPKDVMFSGWVGDQRGDWDGLKSALTNIIHSAWNNYLNFGMDIGGYRNDDVSPLGREKIVFIRWFQLGAFLPLMENGGMGEHRPWKFGEDVLEIYRNFVTTHHDLSLFFMTAGTECYFKNISVIQPIARRRIPSGIPSTFDYILHSDLFVSPVTDNSTLKTISLPGKNETWSYWFNSRKTFTGEIKNFSVPFNEYPVFIRSGSIIPLHVQSDYSLYGTKYSKDYITLMITKPISGKHAKNIYEYKSSGYNVEYDYDTTKGEIDIRVSANGNNKYIIFLNGINSKYAKCLIKNNQNKDEIILERTESSEFWTDLTSSIFKTNENQIFVKLTDKNARGIHLKVIKIF